MKYLKLFENIDFEDWDEIEINEEDDILTDEDFVKFLKNNNVYDNFIKNLNNADANFKHYWKDINNFCENVVKTHYLFNSFNWANSPEGDLFWRNLNSVWTSLNESVIIIIASGNQYAIIVEIYICETNVEYGEKDEKHKNKSERDGMIRRYRMRIKYILNEISGIRNERSCHSRLW